MNEFDPFDTELTDLLRTERRKGSRYEESIEPERQALLSCLYDHIVALSADEIEHLTVDTLLHPEVYTTEELSQMLDAVMRVDMDRYQFAHIRRGEKTRVDISRSRGMRRFLVKLPTTRLSRFILPRCFAG
jgi:hypothetical protein